MKDIQPIIQEFTEQAKAHYGDRLSKIILFGSYARGEAHEDSDVDLLLLLNDGEVSSIVLRFGKIVVHFLQI